MGSAAGLREQAGPPQRDARGGGHREARPAQHAQSPVVHPVGVCHHWRWPLRGPRLDVADTGIIEEVRRLLPASECILECVGWRKKKHRFFSFTMEKNDLRPMYS